VRRHVLQCVAGGVDPRRFGLSVFPIRSHLATPFRMVLPVTRGYVRPGAPGRSTERGRGPPLRHLSKRPASGRDRDVPLGGPEAREWKRRTPVVGNAPQWDDVAAWLKSGVSVAAALATASASGRAWRPM